MCTPHVSKIVFTKLAVGKFLNILANPAEGHVPCAEEAHDVVDIAYAPPSVFQQVI